MGKLPSLPCICASLRRASRVLTGAYDEALRDSGLRVTQYTLLQVLESDGEMTQGRLGEILSLDTTTLTRSLRPLVTSGLVRSIKGEDRRERVLSLTASGRERHREASRAWRRVQGRVRRHLGDDVWKRLSEDLHVVAERRPR